MTGNEVRAVFAELLPQGEMNRLCRQWGVIERQRQLNRAMLVRAMVMSAGTPGGASQADIWRADLEFEVPRVMRAAFYRWFDEPLEQFMEALVQRALAYARVQQVDLPGPLSGVKDWSIVDSTTIKSRDARLDGRAIDADVRVGGGTNPLPLRLVGVQTPQGDGFFLTYLSPRIGPRQVADRDRVRWELERSIKLDTSVHRLD
jgi:hypothetical protein